jgi:hypothetical protein
LKFQPTVVVEVEVVMEPLTLKKTVLLVVQVVVVHLKLVTVRAEAVLKAKVAKEVTAAVVLVVEEEALVKQV